MAPNGCSGGLYVAATIDRGSASVGMTNSITAALTQGKDAIVKLVDHTGFLGALIRERNTRMDVIVLPSNRPAARFYLGGRQITQFRSEPPAASYEPEDWIASTTTVFGDSETGLTTLPNGETLEAAITRHPEEWLGSLHVTTFGVDTKLLVKLLDAGQRLPVHAHPDQAFASTHLGHTHGKAEAWFILHGGTVHLGLREDVEIKELLNLIETQDSEQLLDLLNTVEVEAGDVVFVPPGQLHAIGRGVFLLEVQEPEDLSILLEWRDFDFDGKRDGHLGLGFDLALDAVTHNRLTPNYLQQLVLRRPEAGSVLPEEADRYFRLERILIDGPQETGPGFAILVAIEGEITAAGTTLPAGSTAVAPHAAGPIRLDGRGELLVCRPPEFTNVASLEA
jgi:mannose-6-phosphate isomerase